MAKKYGGVNNQKTIEQIQEAIVVGAPIINKKMPKSKAGTIAGWIIYYIVTFLFTSLLIPIIGLYEQPFYQSLPVWVGCWLVPSLPFLITFAPSVIRIFRAKIGEHQ